LSRECLSRICGGCPRPLVAQPLAGAVSNLHMLRSRHYPATRFPLTLFLLVRPTLTHTSSTHCTYPMLKHFSRSAHSYSTSRPSSLAPHILSSSHTLTTLATHLSCTFTVASILLVAVVSHDHSHASTSLIIASRSITSISSILRLSLATPKISPKCHLQSNTPSHDVHTLHLPRCSTTFHI